MKLSHLLRTLLAFTDPLEFDGLFKSLVSAQRQSKVVPSESSESGEYNYITHVLIPTLKDKLSASSLT